MHQHREFAPPLAVPPAVLERGREDIESHLVDLGRSYRAIIMRGASTRSRGASMRSFVLLKYRSRLQ